MMACHCECVEKVMVKCMKSRQRQSEQNAQIQINIPHKWKVKQFLWPTMCTHCGQLIKGLYKQGLQCESCKMTCHKKCKDLIANTCGTDLAKLNAIMAQMQ